MALAVKHSLQEIGRVHGIDPYTADAALEGTNAIENQEWWSKVDYGRILQSARDALARAQVDKIVQLIIHRSHDVVSAYSDRSITMTHMDSNHSEECSCYEVETWAPKMRPGGFWVFDDINWPSTLKAQEKLEHEKGFTLLEKYETWAVYRAP